MTQFHLPSIDPLVNTGTELSNWLNDWVPALESAHKGATRPTYAVPGMIWVNDNVPTNWIIYFFDGANDVMLFQVNPTDGTINIPISGYMPYDSTSGMGRAKTGLQIGRNADGTIADPNNVAGAYWISQDFYVGPINSAGSAFLNNVLRMPRNSPSDVYVGDGTTSVIHAGTFTGNAATANTAGASRDISFSTTRPGTDAITQFILNPNNGSVAFGADNARTWIFDTRYDKDMISMGVDGVYIYGGSWQFLVASGNFISPGGVIAAGNVTAYSDRRLKQNIERITFALDKVKKIGGYTFERKDMPKTDGGFHRQAGVIGQEVYEVLPEVVDFGSNNDYLSVAYGNISALLIEAIKELAGDVDALRYRISQLESKNG